MNEEAESQVNASMHESSNNRNDYRNGYKHRLLLTTDRNRIPISNEELEEIHTIVLRYSCTRLSPYTSGYIKIDFWYKLFLI